MTNYFENLKTAINEGIDGKNEGLSTGFQRLDNYISLKRKMLISVIGSPGSGKSAFTNLAFLMNPFEDNFRTNKVKLKIILFSMERSIVFSFGKWMCLKIFQEQGVDLDLGTLLGWYRNKKLTPDGYQYVEMYENYFNNLQGVLDIYEGQRSPNDIFRIVKGYSEKAGIEENITEFKKKYIPNDPNEHVIVIVDHIGLTKPIKDYPTKKQAIDRLVEHLQYFRDHLGYTCVAVSQLNRDLSNPLYKKMDSFEPHLDNIKETGNLGEASDIVLSLFDPIRYNTTDKNYGDVEKFRSPINGHKYFRSVSILKNSYGIDGASIGTVFMGQNGLFKELPKSSEIRDWQQKDYDQIFNHAYFLQKPLIPFEKAIRI